MSMTDWPPYIFDDQQEDIIKTSVTTSKKTFKCTFRMVLDGKDVKLKKSKLSCNPKKPKRQKVQKLKICGQLGSYIVTISINPNKISKAGKGMCQKHKDTLHPKHFFLCSF